MTINRTHHDLKIDQQPFADLLSGGKTCEIRKDDRGFNVGDTVRLHEREDADYTGRTLDRAITHIQRGYGLPDGLCVLSYAWAAPEAEPVAYAQAWDDAPQHERIVAALTAPPASADAVLVPRELAGRLCSRDNHVRQTARRELRNMLLSEIECESKYMGLLVLPDRMSGHKSDICESSYQEGYNTALDRVVLCNSGKTIKADLLRRLEWAIADIDDYNPELLELRALLAQGEKP